MAKRAESGRSEDDAVLLAVARAVMAVSVQATGTVDAQVSAVQMRALTVLSQLDSTNLITLADALGLGRSATSRLCDRMVAAGLVERGASTANRREIVLTLSQKGQRLLAELDANRLSHLKAALDELPERRRGTVLRALNDFARVAGRQVGSGQQAARR